jgi:hypothetical protein
MYSREQRQMNTLRIEPVNNSADADPAILQAMLGNKNKNSQVSAGFRSTT